MQADTDRDIRLAQMHDRTIRSVTGNRSVLWLSWMLYLGFVVYGSLIPFIYNPLPWKDAVAGFWAIQWLDLQIVSRADWIANIVLYVPLAFLGCAAILGMRRRLALAVPGMVLVGTICLAVAVGVEFTQQFFAPRTVSLNDLLAESIGTLIGLLLWGFGRHQIADLGAAIASGGRRSLVAALIGYAVAYLALSLFPFDLVVSSAELRWKLEGGNQGWLLAPVCGDILRCTARLVLDAVAIAPFGLLAALLWPRVSLRRLFLAGAAVGLMLEPIQLLLASGTSQGLSIPMRGLGMVVGAMAGDLLRRLGPRPVAQLVAVAGTVLLIPYLVGLALVTGWFSAPAVSSGQALARLAGVRWLPLYYHYFTTEPVAMANTLAYLAVYAPVGIWAWSIGAIAANRQRRLAPAPLAAALAASIAFFVEAGKLLFPPEHPDPTNLLIAVAGALLAYALARWLERVLDGDVSQSREQTGPTRPPAPRATDTAATPAPATASQTATPPGAGRSVPDSRPASAMSRLRRRPTPIGIAIAGAMGIPLVAGTLSYPLAWPVLATVLLLYGVLLWQYPNAWLLVLPALLPVLDLSPVTGSLGLDAFDLAVLTTLVVGYARTWGASCRTWPSLLYPFALILLWLSWTIASVRGLWPLTQMQWPPPDNSHSPIEAWMVGKGMLWALLLVPLARRIPRDLLGWAKALTSQGMIAGLTVVALAVLWERHIHVGLWNFADNFRVTGTFASMRTGGAYIEAYLAFAFPFLAVSVLSARCWRRRVLGTLIAALVGYVMMVTFSRGGWAGLVVGLLVVLAGSLRPQGSRQAWIWAAVLLVTVAGASIPVVVGSFAQERLALSLKDLQVRIDHWSRAISLMSPGATSTLVGEGFGQYPTSYLLLAGEEPPPGSYTILQDGANSYLRLGGGQAVYFEQPVAIDPHQRYQLSVRIRQPEGKAALDAYLCEKALLYSFQCQDARIAADGPEPDWQYLTLDLDAGNLGKDGTWPYPDIKLSLRNAGPGPVVDVDDLSLKSSDGRELIVNRDFSQGSKRWLFVTDQDLAWHIHQQWIELYFAQGLLGVLALLMLLIAAGKALWPPIRSAEPFAVGLSGALAGILAVGLLGSVLDTARIGMLIYLGALLPASLYPGKSRRKRPQPRRHRNGHPRAREDRRTDGSAASPTGRFET